MKLYRTPTGHWAGTKDDAAALAKAHNTTYEQCEVPYDKAGLLAFLNEHKVGAVAIAAVEAPAPAPTPVAPTPVVFEETTHQKQMRRRCRQLTQKMRLHPWPDSRFHRLPVRSWYRRQPHLRLRWCRQ